MSGDVVDSAGAAADTNQSREAVASATSGVAVPSWVGQAVWRGVWQLITAVLITTAGLWFARQASDLIRYLILSQLLAFGLEPAVTWLHERRGWRRGSATGLLLAGILVLFVLISVGIGSVLAGQIDDAARQLPVWIGQLNAFTRQHFHSTVVSLSNSARSGQATQQAMRYLQEHAGNLLGAVGTLVGAIFSVLTVGLFTYYLTANGPQIRRLLLSRMPPERQRRALWAWNTAIEKTGGYLYSRGLLALINGGLMFLTLKLLGVPYALPQAIFVGVVAEFIPIVGTYISGAIPVLVALAAVSPVAALIVLGEILIYQQLENYVLSPRISQKTMELNAGVAFAAAMAGGAVGGFIGAFFALPIAAVIQAFLATYSRRYEVVDSDLTRVDGLTPPSAAPSTTPQSGSQEARADPRRNDPGHG
jgi:predicted PurR-regulated permease PerM